MENSIPAYWKTRLDDIEEAFRLAEAGGRAKVDLLCRSAGGREIKYIEYNPVTDPPHKANYSSACGAGDEKHYIERGKRMPVVLLVGAVHGQELEGVAALCNLVKLIETGSDYRGEPDRGGEESFAKLAEKCRLILIPIMNIDGRARIANIRSVYGMTNDEMHYWGQGTWPDGSLCQWPGCKTVHPILGKCGFMGAYYNDDGVNLMHDNFFLPMARETKALFALCDRTAPDFTVLLHGGSNSTNVLLQPSFAPIAVNRAVDEIAQAVRASAAEEGLRAGVSAMPDHNTERLRSFNLTSAIIHVCGGVCATYESNQGLNEKNQMRYDEILRLHYVLFRELMKKYSLPQNPAE